MTASTNPVSPVALPLDDQDLQDQSWLERLVGPEWARLIKGIFTNPLSVIGLLIIFGFVLMALFAPIIAPPPNANWDTTLIPRDGFGPEPKVPGSEWRKNVPGEIPFWYTPLTGYEEWVHFRNAQWGNMTFLWRDLGQSHGVDDWGDCCLVVGAYWYLCWLCGWLLWGLG
ncbi:MAG: hypothetical protein R3E31_11280 [Chloroflexota bacterium]